jgi:predicted DNA-binding protein with PD1-like motif
MKFTKKDHRLFLLKFEHGEEVYQGIVDFAEQNGILNALVSGIGALSDAELGFYHLGTKTYTWKTFAGDHELISGSGNITLVDRAPFLHMHVVLGDDQFFAHGGHLRKGFAGATCEVVIQELTGGEAITRKFDNEIGLNLWECGV